MSCTCSPAVKGCLLCSVVRQLARLAGLPPPTREALARLTVRAPSKPDPVATEGAVADTGAPK